MKLTSCQPSLAARFGAAGAVLGDGRVLIVGGASATGHEAAMVASCELYDPAADRWQVAPPLGVPRQGLALVALADGGVIALGGRLHDRSPLGVVEVWHVGDPAWTRLPDLPVPVWSAQAVVVDAARALLVGGFAVAGPTTTAWWLDRDTGALWPAPPTRFPHADHALALSPEGAPLVAGPCVERLDGERWRTLGGLFGGDADASAMVQLADGRVLLAGGRAVEDADAAVDDVGLLAAGSNGFTAQHRFASGGRWGHTLTCVDDEVVSVGGLTDHRRPRYVETWDVWSASDGWRRSAVGERRWQHVQVRLGDGSTILVGGADDDDGCPGPGASRAVSRLER